MQLASLKGLGPAKAKALQDAGITTVEDLAGLDLRRNVEVPGITQDGLKALKARARQQLRADGAPVPKAPYTKGSAKATPRGAAKQRVAPTPPAAKPAPRPVAREAPKKRGLFRRLLARN